MDIVIYFIVAFVNVFIHVVKSIAVIKSTKLMASAANCVCYTFSAIVIKFIAEIDLWMVIAVQAITNFIGCYAAMWFCERLRIKKLIKHK